MSYQSDRGSAIKARLSAAFKRLKAAGYVVMQDVAEERKSRSSPYRRLMRWVTHEAAPRTKDKALATGAVWTESADTITGLRRYHARVGVHYRRTSLDGYSYVGKPADVIRHDVLEALREAGLEALEDLERPTNTRQDVVGGTIWVEVPEVVIEAAQAAYKFDGHDAYLAVLDPRKAKNKENGDE